MTKQPDVSDAYALSSDDDIRKLYADWATSYDLGFGDAMGYRLPQEVAIAFVAAGGRGPVLDFGAGTGLVGEQLARRGIEPIDGVDLSPQMLAVAQDKQCYRDLSDRNILAAAAPTETYKGLVSAGTFTRGHVGPDALAPLADHLEPGGLFAISINAQHYAEAGFQAKIAALEPVLQKQVLTEVRIYDDRADDAHRNDRAYIFVARRA